MVRGWAPAVLLDSYEAERRPVAEQTIALAAVNMRALPTELGDIAITTPGPDGEAARDAAATAVPMAKRAEFHSLGLVLGYGYGPDAAVQAPSTDVYLPRVRPGNRLPHTRSADGDTLFDLLGRGFAVLGPAAAAKPLVDAAAGLGVPISHTDLRTRGLAPADGCDVVLVRPDQHIALIGQPVDPLAILASAVRGFAPRPKPAKT